MFSLFMSLAIFCAIVNIVFSALILDKLRKRNIKINYFLIRLLLPKYVYQYKKITREESGEVGGLFYGWIVSIDAALIFAVAGLVVRAV